MNETHRQDCAFDLRSFVCEFFYDLHNLRMEIRGGNGGALRR